MNLKSITPRSTQHSRPRRWSNIAVGPFRGPRAAATIALIAIAIATASGAWAGTLGVSGTAASGVQILNLGAAPTDGSVRFWPQSEASPIDVEFASDVPPGSALNMYLPGVTSIPAGAYAVVSTTDEPSGALGLNTWLSTGAMTIYTAPDPGLDIIAPHIAIGSDGNNSIVSIQNTDADAVARITLSLTEAGADEPAAEAGYSIPAGRSISADLAHLTPFAALGDSGFVGALRVTSEDVPVAVHVLTDDSTSMGVFDYEGLRSDAGATTLYVPRFRIAEPAMSASGELNTSVAVANPGLTPVDVSIDYTGTSGSCAEDTATSESRTLSPGSMTLFDDAEASGFPAGCAGYSTVQASGGNVLAVVIHREFDGATAIEHAAHRAISIDDAGETVHLPLARNRFGPSMKFTSELVVTNPGTSAATVEIIRFSSTGGELTTECEACGPFSLSAGTSVRFEAGEIDFPEGEYGSLRIDSEGPVAATMFDVAIGGGLDTSAFTGIAGGVTTTVQYLPIVFNSMDSGLPTPPPSATPVTTVGPTQTPTAVPTPGGPVGGRGLSGAGATGVMFFNPLLTSSVDIDASFQLQGGGSPVAMSFPDVSPRTAVNFFLPASKDLENGIYAVLASGEHSIGAMYQTNWPASGASVVDGDAKASSDIVVPYVAKAYDGRTSYVTIQNTDAVSATTVLIQVNDQDGVQADGTTVTLAPGESETVRLSDTSLFSVLPASFIGSLIASADVEIAAHAMVEDTGLLPRGVFDAPALTVDSADDELYVPRFSNAESVEPGLLSTWIAVVNPGGSELEATVSFAGERGSCVDESATLGPIALQSGGMAIFDAAGAGLPTGCGGSALVESVGGEVLAYAVHDTAVGDGRLSAAHPAFGMADTDEEWFVPVFRRRHIASLQYSTEVTVLNPGETAVDVTLYLRNSIGEMIEGCTECSATIDPDSSLVFDADSISAFREGMVGTALVQSDGPVVVLMQEFARLGANDSVASAAMPLSSEGDTQASLPFVARGWGVDTDPPPPPPTPTPSPTSAVYSITVNAFVDVSGAAAGFDVVTSADEDCPACDLQYDDDDREAALLHPLPPLTFRVVSATGGELGRGTTESVEGVQVAVIDVLSPTDDFLVELVEEPEGWTHCPNESNSKQPTSNMPGALALDASFHFSNICVPDVPDRGTTIWLPYVVRLHDGD